ncbi:MAG: prepilin-type N-terminal cleavage/methylation domain-containing protein [Patescibacteria group bacterium]
MKKNINPKKFFSTNSKNNRGFTLVELLLYVGLSAVLVVAVSVFLSMLLGSRIKNQAIGEVEQQGLQVMQIITQTIRNADLINSPSIGTNAPSLSLNTTVPSNNPTIFDLSGGAIRLTEGAGAAVSLTNSRITASNLTFQNLSRPSTPGTLRIQFTLSYKNPNNVNEYDFQKTFIASGTLR